MVPAPKESASQEADGRDGFETRPYRPDLSAVVPSHEPPKSQSPGGSGFTLRLKIFYAALFITLGVQLPFLPVWFAARGLDASEIGLALAIPMLVRALAIPVATRVADRHDALRAVIVTLTATGLAGYCVLGLAAGFTMITAAYALASAAYAPVMMLTDAYALRGLARRGRTYGPVRLWGSAAFIVASFGAGLLLDVLAPGDLIWLIVAAMGLATIASLGLSPIDSRKRPATAVAGSARALWRDPAFIAVVVAASFVQSSHALYYGFSTIDWQTSGFDGSTIGALWALGVIAEIALFAVSGRLPATITPTALLLGGAVGAVVRWIAMGLSPPAAMLPLLQCLHGLSFGATHLGALAFVVRVAPEGLGATAQGYLSVALGLAMAAATGLAGLLYEQYGAAAYGFMAIGALMGAASALVAHRLRR